MPHAARTATATAVAVTRPSTAPLRQMLTTTALALAAALAALATPAPARAQATGAPATATAKPASADDSLYRAFGAQAGLQALVDDFVTRLTQDARTGPFFAKSNLPHLREQLTSQFCVVSGGPCAYQGQDMKTAHQDMDIGKADFNALVEVLQQAMDARGLPFAVQNRLLARLAPMHRDIITR